MGNRERVDKREVLITMETATNGDWISLASQNLSTMDWAERLNIRVWSSIDNDSREQWNTRKVRRERERKRGGSGFETRDANEMRLENRGSMQNGKGALRSLQMSQGAVHNLLIDF